MSVDDGNIFHSIFHLGSNNSIRNLKQNVSSFAIFYEIALTSILNIVFDKAADL